MRYLLFILLLLFGCSTKNIDNTKLETTCLVLSVGAAKGIAHIGAIEALRDLGYDFDYVFGNSAGSIAGAVYANNPKADMKKEMIELIDIYFKQSKKDGLSAGVGTTLLAASLFGWNGFLPILGMLVAYDEGFKMDFKRFQYTLSTYFRDITVNTLEIPFATSYWDFNNHDEFLKIADNELVASAVSYSCMNPLIFKDSRQLRKLKIDAGADRVSSTPIQDAYNLFKPHYIIAINVSSEKAIYTNINSKVDEIVINAKEVEENCNFSSGDFTDLYECVNNMYNEGYNSVINYFNNK